MTIVGDVASIGECMVEMASSGDDGLYRQGFAGDTLNTAWYVRALTCPAKRAVRYVSAVGNDGISERMLTFLEDNGIGTSSVARLADRTVGLYLITLDGAERSFTYWRSTSAAKKLAADPAFLASALDGAGLAYFSGITLAILEPEDRAKLFSVLADFRARGGEVAYDPNIRPRLWADRNTMATVITEGYSAATIALPTFPDDADLFGDTTPAATLDRLASLGVREIVVKDGAEPSWVRANDRDTKVPALNVATPVDTTGAGDSFNGGYIAARLAGRTPAEAAAHGHAVAARVICHRGALVDMPLFADLAYG